MSIQYPEPGFELTAFDYESSPLTTRPGLPQSFEPKTATMARAIAMK